MVIGFLWRTNRVTYLEPPILKIDKTIVNKQMTLAGIGYPNARVVVYINEQFVQDIPVSASGAFQGNVLFTKEGSTELKAKQIYKNVSSDFSAPLFIQIDLTPPNKTSFQLTSAIPDFSKEQLIKITGKADPANKVIINNVPYSVASDGNFSSDFTLVNGENTISISLGDEAGNTVSVSTHKITVDNLPPKVNTSFCGSKPNSLSGYTPIDIKNLRTSEEYVCISTGQWEDWRDPAPIPIVGYVIGGIGSITVDGKSVYPDENDEIYQRVYLPVPKGLNKYRIVVMDKYGNQTNTSLSMTVQSVRSGDYDEVLDRLDDIESQINQ